MSYFAVLHDEPKRIKVLKCHVNLWQLQGRFARVVLFDVGLALRINEDSAGATPGKCTQLRLALPFGEAISADIHGLLRDAETSSLVFGQPVDIQDGGERLRVGEDILALTACAATEDQKLRTKHGSVWCLELAKAMQCDETVYLRVRFRVRGQGSVFQVAGSGQLIDFRIADTRGSVADASWKGLAQQFVSIATLNVFVIVPATWRVQDGHPGFQYVRLLEGRAWSPYLKDETSSKKMVVYYWRQTEPPVTAEKPFRAFLHLSESSRIRRHIEYALVAIFGAVVTVALLKFEPAISTSASTTWNALPGIWKNIVAITTTLGLIEFYSRAAITALVRRVWNHLTKGRH